MSKMSRLAIVAAIVASVATPAFAQSPYAHRRSYNYYPAPYSKDPAATGGRSSGYPVGIIFARGLPLVHHSGIIEASLLMFLAHDD
jgi:hypothetical protein